MTRNKCINYFNVFFLGAFTCEHVERSLAEEKWRLEGPSKTMLTDIEWAPYSAPIELTLILRSVGSLGMMLLSSATATSFPASFVYRSKKATLLPAW